jgi:hypothetical protein
MAAPSLALLPAKTQLVTVSTTALEIAPPGIGAKEFASVNPETLRVPVVALKMRLAPLPLSVRTLAPGPLMLRLLVISSSPLVRVIVPDTAKVIVSPEAELAMVSRNDPGPLSLEKTTVRIAPWSAVIWSQITSTDTAVDRTLVLARRSGLSAAWVKLKWFLPIEWLLSSASPAVKREPLPTAGNRRVTDPLK